MHKCIKVKDFDYHPLADFDVMDACRLQLAQFEDGSTVIKFGNYGCQFSATLTKKELKPVIVYLAPFMGLSVVDMDEVWEQEKADADYGY